jgi:hypothetical protein
MPNARPARWQALAEDRLMPDYALMNQYLYEGNANEVERMTKEALAEGRTVQ